MKKQAEEKILLGAITKLLAVDAECISIDDEEMYTAVMGAFLRQVVITQDNLSMCLEDATMSLRESMKLITAQSKIILAQRRELESNESKQ